MSYTQYTLASFIAELAQALSDPGHVYWSQDELTRALYEGLYLWGALTSYWTTRGTFNSVASTPFYDLSVQFPALRARTYSLGDLTREIQYHLLEPANGTSGAGMTQQFTIGQITSALSRHRNQLVIDSRIPLTFSTINVPSPAVDRVQLPQNIALVARAAWVDGVSGIVTPLRRSDSFAAQSYSPIWNQTPGTPYGYSQAEAMPLTMGLIPPPQASGAIHLTYATSVLLTVADGTLFRVPNEFALAIKYGALYEVLSTNSQGYDPIRSKYAAERYRAAVELAAMHRSIIQVRSNDKLLSLTTLAELDAGKPYWQTGTGTPAIAACAYDLLALSRVPSGVFSITCDLSQSAPLPVNAGDYIQLGSEELPYIFDYCRHILQIKVGGVEFVQSMPLMDNFLKGAGQRSQLIKYKARYLTPLFDAPQKQESQSNAA